MNWSFSKLIPTSNQCVGVSTYGYSAILLARLQWFVLSVRSNISILTFARHFFANASQLCLTAIAAQL